MQQDMGTSSQRERIPMALHAKVLNPYCQPDFFPFPPPGIGDAGHETIFRFTYRRVKILRWSDIDRDRTFELFESRLKRSEELGVLRQPVRFPSRTVPGD
jgi:hypothetical protein